MMRNTNIRFNMRAIVNCWLRYTLAQPVDIDLNMLFYFLQRYFVTDEMMSLLVRTKEYLSAGLPFKTETLPEAVRVQ